MNAPLITVIVPAYNVASFVEEAIASVLGQTWTHWELIVVDDGSTDGTPGILARQGDPRIRVIRQANAGVSAARNAALDVASGEFVTFLDADDRLPRDALMHRASYLLANEQVDIVNGRIRVTEYGETSYIYIPSTSIVQLLPHLAALDERFFFGSIYMLRRSRIGFHRFRVGMTHCEDLCFFLELANNAGLVYGAVDAEVYEYRKREFSAMADLEGIERGYLAMVGRARGLDRMTARRMMTLRYRISSILAKCWLRRARPLRAARAVCRVWAG
jgi:glycosyltransferase involved in cell wall biosynthesis